MEAAELWVHQQGLESLRIPLYGEVYRIGRDPDGEVVINHGAVSKRHALLEKRGRHWLLTDNGSTNGLSWQGHKLHSLELRPGDRVRLGPSKEAELPELEFRQTKRHPWLQLVGRQASAAGLGLAGFGMLLLAWGSLQVPVRGSLATVRGPLALYDRSNKPLSSVTSDGHRENQGLADFSPALVKALLSSEDTRFWWHPGIDPIGTSRALVTNLLGGKVLEGGSTLTQQLARSLYPEQVGQGETLGRKWRELLVALQLEARFSKRDLLLSYLNRVYLGVGWGFEDAAQHFFRRSARDLSLEQAALLVGLLPSPNGHDPCAFPREALSARNGVLTKMADEGRLSPDDARRARRTPVLLDAKACGGKERRPAPFYTDQVQRDLENLLGPEVAAEGNFLVETHLDPVLQEVVETKLREYLRQENGWGVQQGAVVVLDSRTGGVLSLVGGKDYNTSQFNRATQALRQPGSTFKLMTYLVALERGLKPWDPVSCDPVDWGGQSFSSGCGGSLSLSQALAISSNTAALRLGRRYGLEAVVKKARDLGITTPLAAVPGLVLGQSETRLMEMTAAYGAIANDGLWMAPTTIRRLTDAEPCANPAKNCRQPSRTATSGRRVIPPGQARLMQGLLRGVVQGGTGTAASLGGQEWGKTGTTNEGRDLLFIGYEPSRHWIMGIWLGNDDSSPSGGTSGLAAQLWGDIIRSAGRGSTSAEAKR
ncbi:MAG: FHA domain-containing protein [Synechococcaceae bacterium WB6_3B_236]|nr:FHA domain-containing protein [Synechococcaceae bacterium WB6_3B_236]